MNPEKVLPLPQQNKTSFQKTVFSVIEQMTGDNNVLAISYHILKLCNDLETGFFLSQLIYWTDKGKSPYGWIYKTAKEWHEELLLSQYSIAKARKNLVKLGIIETKKKRANGFPTIHYRINKKVFWKELKKHLESIKKQSSDSAKTNIRSFEIDKTITEITTETSTEITKPHKGTVDKQPSRPLSFEGYLGQCKTLPDKEVSKSIQYFLNQYKKRMRDEHPRLRPEQWQKVADTFFVVWDDHDEAFDVDSEELEIMIDKYFDTKFQDGCNYSILHFNSEGVKKNRYYEECY